jgi:hypothetical protein
MMIAGKQTVIQRLADKLFQNLQAAWLFIPPDRGSLTNSLAMRTALVDKEVKFWLTSTYIVKIDGIVGK